MKYYKQTGKEFLGFYDIDIHGDIVGGEDFHEITDEFWQSLLDGQSEGNEIRILSNGELGLYTKKPMDREYIQPIYDYDKEIWTENATLDEQLSYWEEKMIVNQRAMNERGQLGLAPTKEQTELKDRYLDKHKSLCHELALKENILIEKSTELKDGQYVSLLGEVIEVPLEEGKFKEPAWDKGLHIWYDQSKKLF